MKRIVRRAISAAVALGAIGPTAAIGAPVEVTAFSLSPPCARPGASVTSNVTVQNTTVLPQRFWGQTRTSYYGYPVATSEVLGPYDVLPFASASQGAQTPVPSNAPWGWYSVTLGIGPAPDDAMGWSTRSAMLKVSPFC